MTYGPLRLRRTTTCRSRSMAVASTPRRRCWRGWPKWRPTGKPDTLPSTNFPEESYHDLDLLISTLDRHGVDHVVVGGVAARAYGATRLTHDLDCVVRRSKDNLERVSRALRDLGAYLRVDRMSDAEMGALAIPVGRSLSVTRFRSNAAPVPGRRRNKEGLVGRALTGDTNSAEHVGAARRTARRTDAQPPDLLWMARSSGSASRSFGLPARSFASMMSARLAARTTNPAP